VLSALALVWEVLCGVLGGASALATSPFVAYLLVLAPHGDDFWFLKAAAALLRLAFAGGLFLRSLTSRGAGFGLSLLKLVSTAAIEVNAILPQPIFSTMTGGAFKLGDVGRAATYRAGRTAWRATAAIDTVRLCVALGCTFVAARLARAASRARGGGRWVARAALFCAAAGLAATYRDELEQDQLQVRDRGLLMISARFTYDLGEFDLCWRALVCRPSSTAAPL
jgi:hypothetical protein